MSERWIKTRVRTHTYGVTGGVVSTKDEIHWVNMAWVRLIRRSWLSDNKEGSAIIFGIRSEMNESHAANAVLHVLDPPEHFLQGRPS